MQKAKIIKEIIGKILEPEGFIYDKEIKDWGFFKEFKNRKNEISRQSVEFDMSRFCKCKLRMCFHCFSGLYRSYGLNSIVPNCPTDGIEYKTEDNFQLTVKKYADILNDYGIQFLKDQENPDQNIKYRLNEYFRIEDYYLLYEKHDFLANKFITDNNLDVSTITIDDAFDIMKDYVQKKREEPFVNSRDSFVELAAFYGCILSRTEPFHWEIKDFKIHAICTLVSDLEKNKDYFINRKIYFAWKGMEDELDELKKLNKKIDN